MAITVLDIFEALRAAELGVSIPATCQVGSTGDRVNVWALDLNSTLRTLNYHLNLANGYIHIGNETTGYPTKALPVGEGGIEVIAAPGSLVIKINPSAPVNFNGQQVTEINMECLSTANQPTGLTMLDAGRYYFNTDTLTPKVWNGDSWQNMSESGITTPDASVAEKGKIRLAGSLTGTADAPLLNETGVVPGAYYSPQIFVESDGRISFADGNVSRIGPVTVGGTAASRKIVLGLDDENASWQDFPPANTLQRGAVTFNEAPADGEQPIVIGINDTNLKKVNGYAVTNTPAIGDVLAVTSTSPKQAAWGAPASGGGGSSGFVCGLFLFNDSLDVPGDWTDATVIFPSVGMQVGGLDWATTPGKIYIPAGKGGHYHVKATVGWDDTTGGHRVVYVNTNSLFKVGHIQAHEPKPYDSVNGPWLTDQISGLMELAAGDWVQLNVFTDLAAEVTAHLLMAELYIYKVD